jgi:hypothetical protein
MTRTEDGDRKTMSSIGSGEAPLMTRESEHFAIAFRRMRHLPSMRFPAPITLAAATAATLLLSMSPSIGAAPGPPAQGCTPPVIEASTDPNIFTEEQETFLGDAIAEQVMRNFRVIDDPAVTATLQGIGDRLMQRLPDSKLKIRMMLIDLPEANAFVLPGGRIMVSRKMVSFVATEDELAGVLAHELGHLVTRQQTIAISRQFKAVLNVTSAGDRADIFEKYHRLLDNQARNPKAFRQSAGHEGRDQVAADRMGIWLLASAGYDPQAFPQFWDRYAQTGGDTGGFFSELFGTTSPDARRLREAMRQTAQLPAACVAPRPAVNDSFRQWQGTVRAHVPRAAPEALTNVVSRTRLDPPLRGEFTHIRFSPDGQHILAQDDGGITVLTRTPLASVFRIIANEAMPAAFTPDSRRIVFHTPSLRVETWNVATRRQESIHEIVVQKDCWQSRLSPDGRTIACFDPEITVSLIDVETGAIKFQKKNFFQVSATTALTMIILGGDLNDGEVVTMGFSPDGRYFAAGHRSPFGGTDGVLVYDMQTGAQLAPKGDARKHIATNFVFTGPTTMVAVNPDNQTQSALITLPAAEITGPMALMNANLAAATRGNYLFVRPMQKYAVGVLELAKGVATKGLPTPAIDVYDDVFAAERGNGELGLYNFANNQLTTQINLPPSALGRLRAAAISPDLKWIAFSERTRGGVWDLTSGKRLVHMRGFRGAAFDQAGQLAVDLPRYREEPRRITHIDPSMTQGVRTTPVKEQSATQYGNLLLVREQLPRGPSVDQAYIMDVRDVRTGASLWKRTFDKDLPGVFPDAISERIAFVWRATAQSARDDVRRDPELRKRLDALREAEGDFIVQVVDARAGKPLGTVFVETGKGSFSLVGVATSGDFLAVEDSANRTRVYAIASGDMKGRVFGRSALLHGGRSLLAVMNGNRVSLHDANTLTLHQELMFGRTVSFTAFSSDGTKLMALTSNHEVIVVDVSK